MDTDLALAALGALSTFLACTLLLTAILSIGKDPSHDGLARLGVPGWASRRSVTELRAAVAVALAAGILLSSGWGLALAGGISTVVSLAALCAVVRARRAPEPGAAYLVGWRDDRPADRRHMLLAVAMLICSVATVAAGLGGWSFIANSSVRWGFVIFLVAGEVAVLVHRGRLPAMVAASGRTYRRWENPVGAPTIDGRPATIDGKEIDPGDLLRGRDVLLVQAPRDPENQSHLSRILPQWRSRLPHLDIHVIDEKKPSRLGLPRRDRPFAVVLGTDGRTAGGPVRGPRAIAQLAEDLAAAAPSPYAPAPTN
ncbi:hypothetical protein ACPYO6_12575 [Georgenia sp. Z1344]|uniref:hypothetical protein n=1 Tax=Georgenia sp. Z1344 TaxID=3416706 RepID=UPI003CFA77F7